MAIEAIDGRKGIDSLAQLCREKLDADPLSGCRFIFRTRSAKAIRILAYDGQGFWLASSMEFEEEIRCNFRSPQQYLSVTAFCAGDSPARRAARFDRMNTVGGG